MLASRVKLLALAALSVSALSASVANAQFAIPTTIAESATSSGLNTIIRQFPRVHQGFYDSSVLPAVTGPTALLGMQLRLSIGENWRPAGYVGASWPNAAISFTDYTITIAKATPQLVTDGEFLSLTPTFNSYLLDPVVVRTGPLTIPAGAFLADGGAAGIHSFANLATFSTPFIVSPGDSLVVQVRHSGYGSTGTPLNAFFATIPYTAGAVDAISSTASATAAAPSGFTSPYIINFVIPEPAALSLLAPLGLMLARRRNA